MLGLKTNFSINLIELRFRTIYAFYSLLFSFLVCFIYKVPLFFLISDYFLQYESGFIYTNLLDPILIYLKLSILTSFFISLPVFGYLYGYFFFKSLYTSYLNYFILYFILIYFSSFFLLLLLSKLIIPNLFEFLINFQQLDKASGYELVLKATITQYYILFFNYIYIFIILIIIPNLYLVFVFIGVINKINFLNYKFRRYLYLITLFIFLIFAPPDFWIQLIILPFIIIILEIYIYIITFLYSLYFNLRREGIEPSTK